MSLTLMADRSGDRDCLELELLLWGGVLSFRGPFQLSSGPLAVLGLVEPSSGSSFGFFLFFLFLAIAYVVAGVKVFLMQLHASNFGV